MPSGSAQILQKQDAYATLLNEFMGSSDRKTSFGAYSTFVEGKSELDANAKQGAKLYASYLRLNTAAFQNGVRENGGVEPYLNSSFPVSLQACTIANIIEWLEKGEGKPLRAFLETKGQMDSDTRNLIVHYSGTFGRGKEQLQAYKDAFLELSGSIDAQGNLQATPTRIDLLSRFSGDEEYNKLDGAGKLSVRNQVESAYITWMADTQTISGIRARTDAFLNSQLVAVFNEAIGKPGRGELQSQIQENLNILDDLFADRQKLEAAVTFCGQHKVKEAVPKLFKLLLNSASSGWEDKIRDALEKIDVNAKTSDNFTLLMDVAVNNDIGRAKRLIQNGADVTVKYTDVTEGKVYTALDYAKEYNYSELADLLTRAQKTGASRTNAQAALDAQTIILSSEEKTLTPLPENAYAHFSATRAVPVTYPFESQTQAFQPQAAVRSLSIPQEELMRKAQSDATGRVLDAKGYLTRDGQYYYHYLMFAKTMHYDEATNKISLATDESESIYGKYASVLSNGNNLITFLECMMRGLPQSACAELARANARVAANKDAAFGSTYFDVYKTTGEYFNYKGEKLGDFANEEEAKGNRKFYVRISNPYTGEEFLVLNHYRRDDQRTKGMVSAVIKEYERLSKMDLDAAIKGLAAKGHSEEKIRAGLLANPGIPSVYLLAHLSARVSVGSDKQYLDSADKIRAGFVDTAGSFDKAEDIIQILRLLLLGGYGVADFIKGKEVQLKGLGLTDSDLEKLKLVLKPISYSPAYISMRIAPESEPVRLVHDAPKLIASLSLEIEPHVAVWQNQADVNVQLATSGEHLTANPQITHSLLFSEKSDGTYGPIADKSGLTATPDYSGVLQVSIPTEKAGFVKVVAQSFAGEAKSEEKKTVVQVLYPYLLESPHYESIENETAPGKTKFKLKEKGTPGTNDYFLDSSGLAYLHNLSDGTYSFAPEGSVSHYFVLARMKRNDEPFGSFYLVNLEGRRVGVYEDGRIYKTDKKGRKADSGGKPIPSGAPDVAERQVQLGTYDANDLYPTIPDAEVLASLKGKLTAIKQDNIVVWSHKEKEENVPGLTINAPESGFYYSPLTLAGE